MEDIYEELNQRIKKLKSVERFKKEFPNSQSPTEYSSDPHLAAISEMLGVHITSILGILMGNTRINSKPLTSNKFVITQSNRLFQAFLNNSVFINFVQDYPDDKRQLLQAKTNSSKIFYIEAYPTFILQEGDTIVWHLRRMYHIVRLYNHYLIENCSLEPSVEYNKQTNQQIALIMRQYYKKITHPLPSSSELTFISQHS